MINQETIQPLPFKHIEMPEWYGTSEELLGYWNKRMRILFFNPQSIYERIEPLIDIYKRTQGNLNCRILFPLRTDGICRCGCGQQTETMWHSNLCSGFAYNIYSIIAWGTPHARKLIETYYGANCIECDAKCRCDIDHIIPVKHGGGACWLSNFVPLCKKCHKDKTNKDFLRKEYKIPKQTNQLQLFQ